MNYEALIRTNFIRHASLLPSLTGNMEVQRRSHLIFVDCGLSCDTFNIVFITDGQQLSLSELKGAIEHYRQKKFDFCVWVDDRNLTGNVRDILSEAGLSEVGNEPGMYLNLEDYKSVDKVGLINKVVDKEQGFETVILQASEDGLEIYKRLGFKVASRFYEFQLLNGAV